MIPSYWKTFLDQYGLRDAVCEVPPSADSSGLGEFRISLFDEKEILMEATEAHPGIEAMRDGFIPVGCGIDYDALFFIRKQDGASGPLYRLFCDGFPDEEHFKNEAMQIVLASYEGLLAQVGKGRSGRND